MHVVLQDDYKKEGYEPEWKNLLVVRDKRNAHAVVDWVIARQLVMGAFNRDGLKGSNDDFRSINTQVWAMNDENEEGDVVRFYGVAFLQVLIYASGIFAVSELLNGNFAIFPYLNWEKFTQM